LGSFFGEVNHAGGKSHRKKGEVSTSFDVVGKRDALRKEIMDKSSRKNNTTYY